MVGVGQQHGVGGGQLVEDAVAYREAFDILVDVGQGVVVERSSKHVAEFGHGTGAQQFAVQDEVAAHSQGQLPQGMLVAHQLGDAVQYVQFLAELLLYDVLHVALVDDGAVVVHHAFVEEHLRAVAVYVAHEEVVGHGVSRAVGDALRHSFGGAVGEGEAQHVAVGDAALMGMHHTLRQDVCLAASRRRQHQMPSAADFYRLLLPGVKSPLLHVTLQFL